MNEPHRSKGNVVVHIGATLTMLDLLRFARRRQSTLGFLLLSKAKEPRNRIENIQNLAALHDLSSHIGHFDSKRSVSVKTGARAVDLGL